MQYGIQNREQRSIQHQTTESAIKKQWRHTERQWPGTEGAYTRHVPVPTAPARSMVVGPKSCLSSGDVVGSFVLSLSEHTHKCTLHTRNDHSTMRIVAYDGHDVSNQVGGQSRGEWISVSPPWMQAVIPRPIKASVCERLTRLGTDLLFGENWVSMLTRACTHTASSKRPDRVRNDSRSVYSVHEATTETRQVRRGDTGRLTSSVPAQPLPTCAFVIPPLV